MQDMHTADRPVLAHPRVGHRMLESSPTTLIVRVARMFRGMPLDMGLDMALGMALDTATGVCTVRDIGVGREGYPYLAPYPNSIAEVKSPSNCGFSKWTITFPSPESRKGST